MTLLPTPPMAGAALIVALTAACSGGEPADSPPVPEPSEVLRPGSELAARIADGDVVFGAFARPQNAEGGVVAAGNRETDFMFYSLETGPWDIPTMQRFMASMTEASGDAGPHPVTLRIPPIREDRDVVQARVAEGLAAGVEGVVFPHVESAEDAAVAVASLGERGWPGSPEGDVINILLIEDQVGVEAAREIVATPGVSVVIPGPGDLRRAYDGDMEAVEGAIQTVLEACVEFDVPCGITAGVDDIEMRIEQGFRLFIVTQAEAITEGRAAAGREN